MEEQQVGIEEYITSTTGFTGILKHRYNDFQVFEVDLSGKTAHLTSTDAPEGAKDEAGGAALTDDGIQAAVAEFAAVAGQANAEQLHKLLSNIQQQQAEQQRQQKEQLTADAAMLELEVDLLPENSKDTRKAIHQFLKSHAGLPLLATETVAPAGATAGPDGQIPHTVIRVRSAAGQGRDRQNGGQDKRGQKRGRREWRNDPAWPGGDSKFVKFVLLKENMETQAALTIIARMLHSQMRSFGFAGTKDKRGVTAQWVTVFKIPPAKLAALNPRLRGIKLGNFGFTDSHLSLGHLKGNTFRVLMRDLSTQDEQHISAAVCELRDKGFINYFGLQRFGTGTVPTHRVGGALLRGEWSAAVQLIMQGGPEERLESRQARDLYLQKGDIQGALKALPTFLVAERATLQALAKCGSSAYSAALQSIPRTLRSMYLHAWQSWLWNRAASERVRRYGSGKVVAGDLVLLTAESGPAAGNGPAAAAGAEAANGAATSRSPIDGDDVSLLDDLYAADEQGQAAAAAPGPAAAAESADEDSPNAASAAARLSSVHTVTEAEAAAGKFSVQDVVLPMPGSKVQYPQHAAGWKFYCQMAAADGIMLPGMTAAEYTKAVGAAARSSGSSSGGSSATEVPIGHSVQEFKLSGLSGDYRRLLHVPTDLTYRVVRYSYPDEDLLPSDWSQLEQQQQQQQGSRPQKRQRLDKHNEAEQDMGNEKQHQQRDESNLQDPMECHSGAPAAAAASLKDAAAKVDDSAETTAAAAAAASKELVGVLLEFTLPSSCYATMLVRELTKSSTSKASHKQMSTRG